MPIDTTVGGAPPPGATDAALKAFFDQRYCLTTTSPKHPTAHPYFVIDPAGSERKVMVVHLQSSDPPCTPGLPAQRSEISVRKEYTPPGEERWYAMSFYLDRHWPIYDKKTKFVLLQLHTSQKTFIAQPPIDVSVRGDQMTLTTRYNMRPVPPNAGASGDYADKDNTAQLFFDLGTLQLSKWYGFVINARWSHVAHHGHLKIWMGGRLVHEQHQHPNCYGNLNPLLGNYPKIGIYAPGGFSDRWDNRVARVRSYVDFITLAARGGIGPNEMYGYTPCKGCAVEPTFPKT